jgi:hypothetical protein
VYSKAAETYFLTYEYEVNGKKYRKETNPEILF